jgi:hypothetical protein
MANITHRQASVVLSPGATIKGAPLTNAEVDNNFANLNIVVGFRENLTTTAKDNLVAAANELRVDIDSNTANVGLLSNLTTTAKDNIVSAVNELVSDVESNEANVGLLSNLTTTSKDNIVSAVNEVRFDLNNLSQSSINNGTSNVNIATSDGPIEISSNLLPINNEFLSLGSITKGFLSTFYANSLSFSQSFTTSGTGQQAAFVFNLTDFRSGEYFVQMTSGSNVHITKIHLTHNTTHAFMSQFGDVVTNASVGTFDADVAGSDARLLVTPVVSGTILKAHTTLIKS